MSRTKKGFLKDAFAKHRLRCSKRRYSDAAKKLARDARQRGHSVAEIAAAAGLCDKTVYGWLAESASASSRIKELKIVEDAPRIAQRLLIHLPSGITIEVA